MADTAVAEVPEVSQDDIQSLKDLVASKRKQQPEEEVKSEDIKSLKDLAASKRKESKAYIGESSGFEPGFPAMDSSRAHKEGWMRQKATWDINKKQVVANPDKTHSKEDQAYEYGTDDTARDKLPNGDIMSYPTIYDGQRHIQRGASQEENAKGFQESYQHAIDTGKHYGIFKKGTPEDVMDEYENGVHSRPITVNGQPLNGDLWKQLNSNSDEVKPEDIQSLKNLAISKRKELANNPSQDLKSTIQSGASPLQGYVSNLGEETKKHPLEALDALEQGALRTGGELLDLPANVAKGVWNTISPSSFAAAKQAAPGLMQQNALANRFGLKPGPFARQIAANQQVAPTAAATGGALGAGLLPLYDMPAVGKAVMGQLGRIPIAGKLASSVDALLANAPVVQRMAHAGIGGAPLATGLAANQNIQQNQGKLNPAQLPGQTLAYMAGISAVEGLSEVAQEALRKTFNLKQAKAPPKPQEPNIEPQQYIPGQAGTQLQQLMSGQLPGTGGTTVVPVRVRKAMLTIDKRIINFVDPVEKALYMVGTKAITSKPVVAALKWLRTGTSMSDQEILEAAEGLKNGVKALNENTPPGFELKIEKGQAQQEHQFKLQAEENTDIAKQEQKLAKAAAKEADRAKKQAEKLNLKTKREHEKTLQKKAKDAQKAEDEAFKKMEAANKAELHKESVELKKEYNKFKKERRQYQKEYEDYKAALEAEEAEAAQGAANRINLAEIDYSLRANRLAWIRTKPEASWNGLSQTTKLKNAKTTITELGNLKVAENNARANYLAWVDALRKEMGIEERQVRSLKYGKVVQIRESIPDLVLERNKSSIEITPESSGTLSPDQLTHLRDVVNGTVKPGIVSKEEAIANNVRIAKKELNIAEDKYETMREQNENALKEVIPEDTQKDYNGFNVYHNPGNFVAKAGKTAKTKEAQRLYGQLHQEAKASLENVHENPAEDQLPHVKRELKMLRGIATKTGDLAKRARYTRILKALGENPNILNDPLLSNVLGPLPQFVQQVAEWAGDKIPDSTTLQSMFLTVKNLDIYGRYAPQVKDYICEQAALIFRDTANVRFPKTAEENEAYMKALRLSADETEIESATGEFAPLANNPNLISFILKLRTHQEEMREMLKDAQEFYFPDPEGGKPIPPANPLFGRGRLYGALQSDIDQLGGGSWGGANMQTALSGYYKTYTTFNMHIHYYHFWEGIMANTAQDPFVWVKIGNARMKSPAFDTCLKMFQGKGPLQTLSTETIARNPVAQKLKDWDTALFGKLKERIGKILPPAQQQAFVDILQGVPIEQWKRTTTLASGIVKAAEEMKMEPAQLAQEIVDDANGVRSTPNVLRAYISIADHVDKTIGAGVPGFRNLGVLDHVPILRWTAVFMTTRLNQARLYNGFIGESLDAMKRGDIRGAIAGGRKAATFTALSVLFNGSKGLPVEVGTALSFMAPEPAKQFKLMLNQYAIVGNWMNSHPTHVQNALIPLFTDSGGVIAQAVEAAQEIHASGDEKPIKDKDRQENALKRKLRAAAFFAAIGGAPTLFDSSIGSEALIGLVYAVRQGMREKKTDFTFSQSYFPTFVGKPILGNDLLLMRKNVPTNIDETIKEWLIGGETTKQLEDATNADSEDGAKLALKVFDRKAYDKYLEIGNKMDRQIAAQYKKDHGKKSEVPVSPARYYKHKFSWVKEYNRRLGGPMSQAIHKVLERHIEAFGSPDAIN